MNLQQDEEFTDSCESRLANVADYALTQSLSESAIAISA